jgi:hypothetical protein
MTTPPTDQQRLDLLISLSRKLFAAEAQFYPVEVANLKREILARFPEIRATPCGHTTCPLPVKVSER